MRFVVVVALVFRADRNDEKDFDLWEILTPIEADGPATAIEAAISASKTPRTFEKLGYGRPPVVLAVKSVHTPEPASGGEFGFGRLPLLIGSIGLHDVQLLSAYETIQIPYSVIDIDE
jgi:hypothetical protein